MLLVDINTCILRYAWPISCLHNQPYSVNPAEPSSSGYTEKTQPEVKYAKQRRIQTSLPSQNQTRRRT